MPLMTFSVSSTLWRDGVWIWKTNHQLSHLHLAFSKPIIKPLREYWRRTNRAKDYFSFKPSWKITRFLRSLLLSLRVSCRRGVPPDCSKKRQKNLPTLMDGTQTTVEPCKVLMEPLVGPNQIQKHVDHCAGSYPIQTHVITPSTEWQPVLLVASNTHPILLQF